MPLPIKTSPEDAEAVVAYLKTKPTGATLTEARAVLDSRILDGRKIKAYEFWGLVSVDGERLNLTESGRALARDSSQAPSIYRQAIDKVRPYRSALEWGFHQNFDSLGVNDLASHWHQHHAEALGTENESTIKDAVTCFFNLASGAGLGNYVLGRRGQETRLELNKEEVRSFVEAGPMAPPWAGPPEGEESDAPPSELAPEDSNEASGDGSAVGEELNEPDSPIVPDELRVFIAHGRNLAIVEQVQAVLGLGDIEHEVAEEEESTAIPVPEKVLTAMRRCRAGIICVSVDESRKDGDGKYVINENVLIEIGAAFVLYDQRVVLLWDRRLAVPSNLQGLYRCEYEGDELGWTAGVKLMKAIKEFRK